ncbi:hypothetical protein RRG08_017065 [Elysia crispata]|uniref:Uncharacterized protein n=1 Tax=Elysia crispata TaxID=231223 RepID=A0AAE1D690_9GAST|nr:hypothetical protein RRG08_017065 [Elysia crispata]
MVHSGGASLESKEVMEEEHLEQHTRLYRALKEVHYSEEKKTTENKTGSFDSLQAKHYFTCFIQNFQFDRVTVVEEDSGNDIVIESHISVREWYTYT